MDTRTANVAWDVVECDPFGRTVSMTAWPREPVDGRPYILLVPVDGSPSSLCALQVALQLAAQRADAELHVINVQVIAGAEEGEASTEAQGLFAAAEALDLLEAHGKHCQLHIATGLPAQAILDYARRHNAAEIVIGSHGTGHFQRLLIGSVALDVAKDAPCPVTLVKSHDGAGRFPSEWVDWLIPCDGSAPSLRAVRHVIARHAHLADKPTLHLLNVGNGAAAAPADDATALVDWFPQVREPADGRRGPCAEAVGLLKKAGQPFVCHVEAGDPAPTILAAAERIGCGHIALGSRGLGALGGFILGSVSQAVAQRAALPVTLVK